MIDEEKERKIDFRIGKGIIAPLPLSLTYFAAFPAILSASQVRANGGA